MNKKVSFSGISVFFAAVFLLSAEIQFEKPELNSQDKILFSVNHDISGEPSYSTAFMGDAKDFSSTKILTCYPEKLELLSKGAVLQVRNRWGTARWSVADSNLSWVVKKEEIPVTGELQVPQSVSPDGKWICYVKKTDAAEGKLVLKNASTTQETVLVEKCTIDGERVRVEWNPDSSSLLYEKNDTVYFCEPKAEFQKIQLAEEFRKIGKGSINCVFWANSKTLIYINRDLIYRISSSELYTRGLYSSVIEPGTVCGRLPVFFDERHDTFAVNQDATSLVFIQANKIVNVFDLNFTGFEYVTPVVSKPITDAGGTIVNSKIFWTSALRCILWVNFINYETGAQKSAFYSLSDSIKLLATVDTSQEPAASPDGRKLCFAQGTSLFVYDADTWTLIERLDGEKIISYAWCDNSSLYAGGVSTVKKWNLGKTDEKTKILFLSAGSNVFWYSDTAVMAEDPVKKGIFYEYDEISSSWTKSLVTRPERKPLVQNGRFRVFTGTAENLNFSNALYVRTLSGKAETRPYFAQTSTKVEQPKKIVLAIDALDDSSGLSQILYVLKKYNVPATFFLNGEFIRRYPKESKQIAKSGYECASMFFTTVDLTAKGFVVDEDFIRRGLARNEDEFFQATGSELSLLWHAPFYHSTKEIKTAGEKCGYRYVEAGRFNLDTITLEQASHGKPGYLSGTELVSFYAQNAADGSVIPVSTGISSGSRSDYLYEKLDLLISALLSQGHRIVNFKDL